MVILASEPDAMLKRDKREGLIQIKASKIKLSIETIKYAFTQPFAVSRYLIHIDTRYTVRKKYVFRKYHILPLFHF